METKRKHVPTWLYKLGGRLDKQYGEIVSALSDINAFNAGKKRDKALELIAAWLPDVEKFSKEDVYKRQEENHMKIINLGILAHVDAGKTTLTESLLYTSGAIAELGSVDEGLSLIHIFYGSSGGGLCEI